MADSHFTAALASRVSTAELLDMLAGMPEHEWRLLVELFNRHGEAWLTGAIAATQVRRDAR